MIGKRVLDPKRCRAIIYHGPVVSYQCKRKGRYGGFCGQHDPKAKEARRAAQMARWDAESEARRKSWARAEVVELQGEHFPVMLAAMKDALDAINDRRPGAAREYLKHAIDTAEKLSGTKARSAL